MNPNRQAYFLDRRILYFFEDMQYLPAFTDRGLYYALKQEQKYGKLQGIRLCTEKTFYKWLADGRREMRIKNCEGDSVRITLSKTGKLAQHVERLKHALMYSLGRNCIYNTIAKGKPAEQLRLVKYIVHILDE